MAGREVMHQAQRALGQLFRLQGRCASCESDVAAASNAVRTATLDLAETSGEASSSQAMLRGGSNCGVPLMDAVVRCDVRPIGCWMQGSVGARFYSAVPSGEGSKVHVVKSDEEYEKELTTAWESSTGPGILPPVVLTQFTAQWCGPCRMIAPYLEQLSNCFDHVKFLQVDIDEPNLSKTVRDAEVSAVPTFLFYKDGKVVSQLQGADPRELTKRLTEISGL